MRLREHHGAVARGATARGVELYDAFHGFAPEHLVRLRHPRLIPPVLVQLGPLLGLIYRSHKTLASGPRSFIHLMDDPPHLASNVEGTQLYVLGGSYRVTAHGIEG